MEEMTYSLGYVETTDDAQVEVLREFDSSGDIHTVLNHMRDFLVACGFTYVTQLVAVVDNGGEHASDSN